MAADTAISTTVRGVPYRVTDLIDDEKIIEHDGALIFCSGDLEKCEKIRKFVKKSCPLDLYAISNYAQRLFGDKTPNNTGIVVCWPDGSMVGMLSAQGFRLVPIPWDKGGGFDFFCTGYKQENAYELIKEYLCDGTGVGEYGAVQIITKTYFELSSEKVGGDIHIYSRGSAGEPWNHSTVTVDESYKTFRRITKAEALAPHGIVTATDFILGNGKSVLSSDKSKIRGEYIDARGINIMDAQGHQVLYIDQTGIHWTPKYSPFKYQYSTSANGPWHDTPADSDVYRRESCDGGSTWGTAIKYIAKDGKDGRPGSDANVTYDNIKKALQKAASTQTSFITADEMGAPIIYGGKIYGAEMYANQFNIHTENGGRQGAFSLWGDFLGIPYEMFRIDYFAGDAPYVHLYSPAKGYMSIGYGGGRVTMDGRIDFSNAAGIEWGKHAPKAVFA